MVECRVANVDHGLVTLLIPTTLKLFTVPRQAFPSLSAGMTIEMSWEERAPSDKVTPLLDQVARRLDRASLGRIKDVLRVTSVSPWSVTAEWTSWRQLRGDLSPFPTMIQIAVLIDGVRQEEVRSEEEERIRIKDLTPDTDYSLQLLFRHEWGRHDTQTIRVRTLGAAEMALLNVSIEEMEEGVGQVGFNVIPFDVSRTAVLITSNLDSELAIHAAQEGIPVVDPSWLQRCVETGAIVAFK